MRVVFPVGNAKPRVVAAQDLDPRLPRQKHLVYRAGYVALLLEIPATRLEELLEMLLQLFKHLRSKAKHVH